LSSFKTKTEVKMTDLTKPNTNDSLSKSLNRRGFLKFCSLMAATLALPTRYGSHIAKALSSGTRIPVVWLEFQDCTGDSESFLRAGSRPDPIQPGVTDPGLVDLLLDFISVEYHETIMAPSGFMAEKSLNDVMDKYNSQYLCVVEGSIPHAQEGIFCTIRGRTALSIAQQVLPNGLATIAMGSCATDGGLAAALPNPTGAAGVASTFPGLTNLVNLPGCPANVVNLVATIVYLLTFNTLPDMDSSHRPYFAYGEEIHDDCPREDYYEEGQFVLEWGDEGHKNGWCLYKMGCRGPRTHANCREVKWNGGTGWTIGAGHGCIGCTQPNFWDSMAPFYQPLANE
jgi:hydrogenase small subunit